ncbi:unnamed protein product [Soboliphyme baturini]|uniref:LRRCT domain-containing protein n=1 Tax=Soboliphyme baturini TaxID=241478 RepID=A0A183IGC4_9BILA|nr:unnamed protein product [Soboliphyme baturini]
MIVAATLASILLISAVKAFCPYGCACVDSALTVECDGASLTSIPILLNPRTKSLKLSNNLIHDVTLDELSFYTELEFLDLSANKIQTIEKGAFFRLQNLKILKLNQNLLASIGPETFTGLASLKVLDLSENGIARIATSVFADLHYLETLNLTFNSISSFSPGAFTGLGRLKELHTQYNEITTIPKVALHALTSLKLLDFSHNRISFLNAESFVLLKELEILNFGYNSLDSINEYAFLGLNNLRHLHLDSNQLYRIPTLAFRPLTELQTLSMRDNLIEEIPTSAFEGLNHLRQLTITHCNRLASISLNAFSGLFDLETLILSDNQALSELHPMAFELNAPVALRQIYLISNNLNQLPRNWLPWQQLTTLDLRENPWQCTCEFAWIGEVLRGLYPEASRDNAMAWGPTCDGPEDVRQQPLYERDESEFRCVRENRLMMIITIVCVLTCLSLLTALGVLIVRFRHKLCYVLFRPDNKRGFYGTTVIIPDHKDADKQKTLLYSYVYPNECQTFLSSSSSDYYYCNNGLPPSPSPPVLPHRLYLNDGGGYRMIQGYPTPITEL